MTRDGVKICGPAQATNFDSVPGRSAVLATAARVHLGAFEGNYLSGRPRRLTRIDTQYSNRSTDHYRLTRIDTQYSNRKHRSLQIMIGAANQKSIPRGQPLK